MKAKMRERERERKKERKKRERVMDIYLQPDTAPRPKSALSKIA